MMKRCPDTKQILNFPVDCVDCEFLRQSGEKKECGWHLKQPRYKGKWR